MTELLLTKFKNTPMYLEPGSKLKPRRNTQGHGVDL